MFRFIQVKTVLFSLRNYVRYKIVIFKRRTLHSTPSLVDFFLLPTRFVYRKLDVFHEMIHS
jgi:hypothetical protein